MPASLDWGRRQFKQLDDEVIFGRLIGQAGNVYRARTVVGLCAKAKEPELAEEFLGLMLSDEMMQKWWLSDTMEEADCCYLKGTRLEDAVREIGYRVLNGDVSPEEGVIEVARKMAIEMEE